MLVSVLVHHSSKKRKHLSFHQSRCRKGKVKDQFFLVPDKVKRRCNFIIRVVGKIHPPRRIVPLCYAERILRICKADGFQFQDIERLNILRDLARRNRFFQILTVCAFQLIIDIIKGMASA